MLRVLTLSTLFPDATRPNFGVFVERQTLGLAALDGVEVRVVAPVGIAPFPLSLHPAHRALRGLPDSEDWKGLHVSRPRFRTIPATQGRFHVAALLRRLIPTLDQLRTTYPFNIIDTQFFFPDGPAAVALGRRYGVPVSIKARGADIHHWGH
ncbi:glycoside hydrolase, partial [Nostoc sp. 3335mG]